MSETSGQLPDASDKEVELGKRSRELMPAESPGIPDSHYRKALNTALRILTGRDHSKYELERKLRQRGITGEVLDDVISACKRYDYINDERTSQIYIRQLNRKGYGLKRKRYELTKKGLGGKRFHGSLSESLSETDERECAQRVVQKYRNRFDREKDLLKRKDKVYRFLYSRGFSEGIISEVMQEFD